MKIKTTLLFTALAFGLGQAQASWSFTYNDTTGYSASDVVFTTAASMDNQAFIRDIDTGSDNESYRGGLQTFSVGSEIEVKAINIIVNRLMDDAVSSFRLFEKNNTTAPGTSISLTNLDDDYTLLSSETITISGANDSFGSSGSFNDAPSTMTWTLPTSETLDPGKIYAFNIHGDLGNSSESIVWRYDNGNGYAGGTGFYSNDSSAQYESDTFNSNNSDYSLALVAVPEPGTLVLVGLALGALALFRRRR